MSSLKTQKLIVILGPTASGKTEMAIRLAKIFGGEIISADSRQVYRGMDIGTAKPKEVKNEKLKVKNNSLRFKVKIQKELVIKNIPHHLIDIINPNEDFNVAIYKKLAVKKIKEIQKRGKLPFLVGGTGLYISAITDNISFLKIPANQKLRDDLEKKSAKELFLIYEKLDREGAKFIEKGNKRRLVRAIEVCKITGKPFWQQRKKEKPLFNILQLGIKLPKEKLKERISKRADKMIKAGLEKEVSSLSKKYGFGIPPMRTIGYQEWLPFFKNKITKKELIENIKIHTRQFSKRQTAWFKKNKKINWTGNYKEAKKAAKEFLS